MPKTFIMDGEEYLLPPPRRSSPALGILIKAKRGILNHITNKAKRREVYHRVRVLLEEGDESSFSQGYSSFFHGFQVILKMCSFLQYF